MNLAKSHTDLLRSARRATLVLFVALSTLAGVGFTGGTTSLAQAGPQPEANFNQSLIPPDVPSDVLMGETFAFKVRFKNTGNAIGYGPFIDLAINFHGADNNNSAGPCDGIEFLSAQMIDVKPGSLALPSTKYGNTNSNNCSASSALHPYTGVGVVTFPPGWQLATIELPFGNYDPAPRPEIVVEVTAQVHNYADVNPPVPLEICTRGGFQFSSTTGGPPITEQGNDVVNDNWECQSVTPRIFTIKKEYLGPEDETATGPNFKHKYKITLDIATGQTIGKPLTITDCLPNNMAFEGGPTVNAPASWPNWSATPPFGATPPIGSVNNPPASCLTVAWPYSSVTGVPGPDATVEFEFTVRDVDADGNELLQNCQPVLIANPLTVTGNWSPKDPRDSAAAGTVTGSSPNAHELYAKCLAIQKSVKVYQEFPGGTIGPTPGDLLQYTLNFQISDYKTIGQIKITDRLSDGQLFLTAPAPMLTIGDQFPSSAYTINPLPPAHYSVTGDPHSQVKKCPVKGTTNLGFDVSAALAAAATSGGHPRHQAGILTGGYAAAPPSTAPAVGTLVFYAQIRDDFSNAQSPGDKFVDKHDPLCNEVEIQGTVYKNEATLQTVPSPVSPTQIAKDDSATLITIVTDTLKKSVYAVKRPGVTAFGGFVCGGLNPTSCPVPPAAPDVRPSDQVTFRIEKTIPSSDAENLTVQDWLPLPTFNIAGISFTNSVCGIPTPNSSCLGPTDTLHTLVMPKPIFTADPTTNSIKFDYVKFDDPFSQARKIDLLFTLTVTNMPFADGLYLTNEAQECEDNTFTSGGQFCQAAIAQVHVREPKLNIKKGVVRTDNPNGQFGVYDPNTHTFTPGPAPVPTPSTPPSSCPRVPLSNTNPINSTNLGSFINSDLNSVDAGDWVTFAITIENTGGAPAYNIELADIIPLDALDKPSCFEPNFDPKKGICITYGNGTPIPFTTAPGQGKIIIKLGSPLGPFTGPPGTNIAIITFNAKLLDKDKLKAGCCDNKAQLIRYTSTPDPKKPPTPIPPNFVDAGLGGPFEDNAWVCVKPKPYAKCIQNTSELHTVLQQVPQGSTVDAAIGEIVRFRLITVIPEGTTQGFQIQDLLPPGLTYVTYVGNPKAIFVANNPVITNPLTGIGTVKPPTPPVNGPVSCPGGPTPTDPITVSPVTFPFGTGTDPSFPASPITITNNDNNDSDLEFLIIEFNAQVDNIQSNQASTTLTDHFDVKYQDAFSGNSVSSPAGPSGPVNVHIVEPNLTLTKAASPTTVAPGGTVTYTVHITNTGTADAFDIVFTDTLPFNLTLVSPAFPVPIGCTNNSSLPGNINVICTKLDDATSMSPITYQATVSTTVPCPAILTNTAKVTWTSLPGPQGTPLGPANLTGQQTVGPSGAATPPNTVVNGERNGSTAYPPNPPNSPDPPNDYHVTASATVTVQCRCDLAIKKTVTFTATGLWVSITLTVPAGQYCAPGTVIVGDLAPAGMTFINLPSSLQVIPLSEAIDWNCSSSNPSNLNCVNQNTLAGPYTVTFAFPATVSGSVTNCAKATVSGALVSESCVVVPGTGGKCDLKIEKFTDPAQPVLGQPFAFVVKVTNVGGALCAPNTTVTDTLTLPPSGVTVTGFNPNAAAGWTCPSGPPNITCTNPTLTLQPGQSSQVFAVVMNASPGMSATINNCATVSNPNDVSPPNDPLNNKACATVQLKTVPPGKKAEICGIKFNDLNGNGVKDPGEPGLPGWTINITSPGGPPVTTGANGQYCFIVPLPGTYTVSEAPQPGWTPTTPATQTVTVPPAPTNINFGNKKGVPSSKAEICVTKFNDLDGDGVRDLSEPGLPNWTFTVTPPPPATITTGPQGSFCFGVPAPGMYTVTEQVQSGWTATTPTTQTATASTSQLVNLSFGNKRKADDKKCDLAIRKSVSPNPVASGQPVTIALTITNVGTGSCGPDTVAQDPRPAGLTFMAAPVANQLGWACSLPGGNASCVTGGTLPPGYTATFTFTATVTATPGSTITNCATVSNPADTNQANNQSCVPIQVKVKIPLPAELVPPKELTPPKESPLPKGPTPPGEPVMPQDLPRPKGR